jgi:hypothetical protein
MAGVGGADAVADADPTPGFDTAATSGSGS